VVTVKPSATVTVRTCRISSIVGIDRIVGADLRQTLRERRRTGEQRQGDRRIREPRPR